MRELRKDPVTHEWVIIATERSARPADIGGKVGDNRRGVGEHKGGDGVNGGAGAGRVDSNNAGGCVCTVDTDEGEGVITEKGGRRLCPFCEGNEFLTPSEVFSLRDQGSSPDGPGWKVRVVPNLFAALDERVPLDKSGRGMFDLMSGTGRHEVFIEGPDHQLAIDQVAFEQTAMVLSAYKERYLALREDSSIQHILIFRNHGAEAGASLRHPHSQLIATPMIPSQVERELEGIDRYQAFRGRCVYCDLVREEERMGERLVAANEGFVAFTPFASRYPYEVWVVPREHRAGFAFIDDGELTLWTAIVRQVLGKLRQALNDPPYNYTLHTAPIVEDKGPRYHWHQEIYPRLTTAAGFEMGTGIYINIFSPEEAAERLRNVNVKVTAGTGTGSEAEAWAGPSIFNHAYRSGVTCMLPATAEAAVAATAAGSSFLVASSPVSAYTFRESEAFCGATACMMMLSGEKPR